MPHIHPCKMSEYEVPLVPVTDTSGARLPLEMIKAYVMVAVDYARKRPEQTFKVQQEGWGYPRQQIAPLFDRCPLNITLPYGFIY